MTEDKKTFGATSPRGRGKEFRRRRPAALPPALPADLVLRRDAVHVLRQVRGLESDGALAAAMGMDRSTVNRVISGGRQPSTSFVASLAIVLGAKLDRIAKPQVKAAGRRP